MPLLATFRLDANGFAEKRIIAWDFRKCPEIKAGDTLAPSPAPSISYLPASPALTIGTLTVSGTQVLGFVGIAGGIANTVYQTVCTAYTVGGSRIMAYGDVLLRGP